MKIYFIAALFLLVTSACGKKTIDDINVKDLKSVCECLDALLFIEEEAINFVDKNGGSFKALNASQQDTIFEYYFKKHKDVKNYCKDEFGFKNAVFFDSDCNSESMETRLLYLQLKDQYQQHDIELDMKEKEAKK